MQDQQSLARVKTPRSPKPPPGCLSEQTVSALRLKTNMELLTKSQLRSIFKKYDSNQSKLLEEGEVRKLLTDLDMDTPSGTPPSDQEVHFVLAIADLNHDGSLSLDELARGVAVWEIYTAKRKDMESVLKKYDKNGDALLQFAELKEYLKDLNNGVDVDDKQVEWVLTEADVLRTASLNQCEILVAAAVWYQHVRTEEYAGKMTGNLGLVHSAMAKPTPTPRETTCCAACAVM